jgi:H+-transporting ATPase
VFLLLVYSGLATVYVVRERRAFWRSRPSAWLMAVTALDFALVSFLAARGVLMASVELDRIALLAGAVVSFMAFVDGVKLGVFRLLGARRLPSGGERSS